MNKKVLGIVVLIAVFIIGGYVVWTNNKEHLIAEKGTTTVTHALGTIEVPEKLNKIAVFDYGMLDTLDQLNVDVLGVAKGSMPQYLNKYKGDEYTDIGTLFEPNFEVLAQMAPDVIFISGRQKENYDTLSQIAPTVYLSVDPADYFGSLDQNVTLIGKLVQKDAEARGKLTKMNEDIVRLQQKTEEMKTTGLILLANDDKFSVYGQTSRFGIIHNTFGVIPIDKDIETSTHGQSVGYEYIVTKNPEYLFVIDRAKIVGGNEGQQLFENELMARTKAYQGKHIVFLDPEVWYLSSGGLGATEKMIKEIEQAIS